MSTTVHVEDAADNDDDNDIEVSSGPEIKSEPREEIKEEELDEYYIFMSACVVPDVIMHI